MKSLIKAVAIAAVFAAPLSVFAQSNEGLTRAQVKADLVQVEKAGYNPASADSTQYPADIQAAEARVQSQNGAVQSDVGGVTAGSSQGGVRSFFSGSLHSAHAARVDLYKGR